MSYNLYSKNRTYQVGWRVSNNSNATTDSSYPVHFQVQGSGGTWSKSVTFISGTTYFRQMFQWNYFNIT